MPVINVTNPRHHIDRFAEDFLPLVTRGDPDQLLTTEEVARLLHISKPWLEIGRSKGYGPPWIRMGKLMVRYKRDGIVKWLRGRARAANRRQGKAR